MEQLSLVPVCEKHGTEKAWVKDKSRPSGGVWRCRACNAEGANRYYHRCKADPVKADRINTGQRRRYKRHTYGLEQHDYERLLKAQGGRCAICGATDAGSKAAHHSELFVDHCHATGKVRGLLCSPCNTALGMLQDDIGRLEAAIRYLREATLGTTARAS